MNVTFLIGNGFDLACGMKTSYPDVYEKYIKTPNNTSLIEHFKNDLIKEKTKEHWGNWSDFEMGMAKYASNFHDEKEFIECIADFKNFLRHYLEEEQENFRKTWRVAYKTDEIEIRKYINSCINDFYVNVSKKISKIIKERKILTGLNIRFVSFNYTNTFDMVIRGSGTGYTTHHIHGTLLERDVTIGVDNVSQIYSKFLITKKGQRVFVKPFFNEEEDPEKITNIKSIIDSSDYICAFGLSFGDSDLTWKNAVIDWLKKSSDNHLFLYDYGCSKIMIDDVALRKNEEETQKAIILEKKGFCQEDDSIFEQIHIPIGGSIFDIEGLLKMISDKKVKTA